MRILYIHQYDQVIRPYGGDLALRSHSLNMFVPSLAGSTVPVPPPLWCDTAEQIDTGLENLFQHPEGKAALGHYAGEKSFILLH